jgi:O-antigen/teichoic acid export membrane protein
VTEAGKARRTGLLHEIFRSVFWNIALLPLVAVPGVLLSIVLRRSLGLESGVYDAVLGIANSVLFYSSLGLSGSLTKFLPDLQMHSGRAAAVALVRRVLVTRLAVVIAILVPLNVWSAEVSRLLDLGTEGTIYIRWLSILVMGRAILDLLYRTLDGFLHQLAVNVLSLLNGVFDVCLVGAALLLGLHVTGVFGGLAVSAVVTSVAAIYVVQRQLSRLQQEPGDSSRPMPDIGRVWKLSSITYIRDLSLYFATPAFASPVLLTVLGGPEPVALFATSYFVASSTVTLVVSGFRGIYRPAFARVLASNDAVQLQRAFDLMNKVQILAVVPAGFGLAVMVGDYLPLLYGETFRPAIPIARLLVALLYAETALAVGLLVLWADERYRPVLYAQSLVIVGAPLFIYAAGRFGLMTAACILGGSRVASSIGGYIAARRLYGVRFPWRYASKVSLVSGIMAVTLLLIGTRVPTTLTSALALTVIGAVIVVVGLRVLRVFGPSELEVLSRTNVPGGRLLSRWLGDGAV